MTRWIGLLALVVAGCDDGSGKSGFKQYPDTGWGHDNRGLECEWIYADLWQNAGDGLYQMPPSGTVLKGERYVGGCMNWGAFYGYWTEIYRVAETDEIVCSVTWNFKSANTFQTGAPKEVEYSWNFEQELVEDEDGEEHPMVNDHGTFLCGELLGFDPTTRALGGEKIQAANADEEQFEGKIGFQADPPALWQTQGEDFWAANNNWDEFDRFGDRIYVKKTFEITVR